MNEQIKLNSGKCTSTLPKEKDAIQRIQEFIVNERLAGRNMNQTEFARILDVSPSQLNRWLRNRVKPCKTWEKLLQEKLEMLELEN